MDIVQSKNSLAIGRSHSKLSCFPEDHNVKKPSQDCPTTGEGILQDSRQKWTSLDHFYPVKIAVYVGETGFKMTALKVVYKSQKVEEDS